ncbi:hypothetical protein BKA80DRAFT_343650 [Phyllosticta citrichinensis]
MTQRVETPSPTTPDHLPTMSSPFLIVPELEAYYRGHDLTPHLREAYRLHYIYDFFKPIKALSIVAKQLELFIDFFDFDGTVFRKLFNKSILGCFTYKKSPFGMTDPCLGRETFAKAVDAFMALPFFAPFWQHPTVEQRAKVIMLHEQRLEPMRARYAARVIAMSLTHRPYAGGLTSFAPFRFARVMAWLNLAGDDLRT